MALSAFIFLSSLFIIFLGVLSAFGRNKRVRYSYNLSDWIVNLLRSSIKLLLEPILRHLPVIMAPS